MTAPITITKHECAFCGETITSGFTVGPVWVCTEHDETRDIREELPCDLCGRVSIRKVTRSLYWSLASEALEIRHSFRPLCFGCEGDLAAAEARKRAETLQRQADAWRQARKDRGLDREVHK